MADDWQPSKPKKANAPKEPLVKASAPAVVSKPKPATKVRVYVMLEEFCF